MVIRIAYRHEEMMRMYWKMTKDDNRPMYLIPRGGGKSAPPPAFSKLLEKKLKLKLHDISKLRLLQLKNNNLIIYIL